MTVDIQTTLRAVADELSLRGRYLKLVPWSFVRADTPEGARSFLEGARSRPFAEQDLLTQYLLRKHEVALDSVADGNPCPADLAEEVKVYADTPLDESAGEGYHRGTHLTRIRARAAKTPYLKQATRAKENNRLLKKFLRMGQSGRQVIRFEWRQWKRVLQVRPRSLWKSRKMKSRAAFERIYRMDEMAEVDWTAVCGPVVAPGQGPPPAPLLAETKDQRTLSRLRIEYLASVLDLKRWYEIMVPVADIDEEGRPVERQEKRFFQLLNRAYGQSRPKLMPTIESHSLLVNTEKLALCLQEATENSSVGGLGEGHYVIHADSDPRWVKWSDLGPWEAVHRSLTRFGSVEGAAEHAGCIELRNPELARCQIALNDERCPTLCILIELRRRGWRMTQGRVVHTGVAAGD